MMMRTINRYSIGNLVFVLLLVVYLKYLLVFRVSGLGFRVYFKYIGFRLKYLWFRVSGLHIEFVSQFSFPSRLKVNFFFVLYL